MSEPSEPEPQWERLPHDPAGFFGLIDPIDRRDLKRAYNKLLRRFKPEKAPAEFQKIRAAYEALDERLRYGDTVGPVMQAPQDWREGTTADPESAEARSDRPAKFTDRTPIPRPKPIEQRLETESPHALYRELGTKEDKNPYEYYALALLSDLVERDKPLRFAEWLLSGLKAHPSEGALWRLLHEYLRGPLPKGCEPKLLQAIASVARDDSFYPLTEPLWLRFLRGGSGAKRVDEFAKLLAACESRLRDTQITGKLTFYIRLAGAAMLMGDSPWPVDAADYIDANFEQAPPWMEFDIDMLGLLREYAKVRHEFIAGGELCAMLDRSLRDYFLEDQTDGDRSVVAAQIAIAEDLSALGDAFPADRNDLNHVFYPLWTWVSADVAERNAPPINEQTGPQPNWLGRVGDLVARLGARANNSSLGVSWTLMTIAYRLAQGIALLAPPVVLCLVLVVASLEFFPDSGPLSAILTGLAIAGGLYLGFKACNWLRERWWHKYCWNTSCKIYRRLWRPEIMQLQQRSHLEATDFRAMFEHSVAEDLTLSEYINAHVQQDYGLAILSHAQRFQA